MRILFATAVVSAIASLLPQGQTERPLNKRFDETVRAAIPGAHLLVGKEPQSLLWTYGDRRITIRYSVQRNARVAEERMREWMRTISAGWRQIDGFGDESYSVEPSASGQHHVNFRRGRVLVEVSAFGERTVRQLARLLVPQIDQSIAVGELQEREK